MTDKELLELAAKAQGWIDYPDDSIEAGDFWHTEPEKAPFDYRIYKSSWNPLNDDGDAFRLAVKLELDVGINSPNAVCIDIARDNWIIEQKNNDPYAATRRAIVRAAAEIGEDEK